MFDSLAAPSAATLGFAVPRAGIKSGGNDNANPTGTHAPPHPSALDLDAPSPHIRKMRFNRTGGATGRRIRETLKLPNEPNCSFENNKLSFHKANFGGLAITP